MPTRGSIIASAGVSMHSRWAQLSLLHPRKIALSFSPLRDCNRPSSQPREMTTTTATMTRYTYTLPALNSFVCLAFPSHESPRQTCISRSRTYMHLTRLSHVHASARGHLQPANGREIFLILSAESLAFSSFLPFLLEINLSSSSISYLDDTRVRSVS